MAKTLEMWKSDKEMNPVLLGTVTLTDDGQLKFSSPKVQGICSAHRIPEIEDPAEDPEGWFEAAYEGIQNAPYYWMEQAGGNEAAVAPEEGPAEPPPTPDQQPPQPPSQPPKPLQ